MTEVDADVLAANATFYEAFATRDYAAMDEIWARDQPVTCVHPGWSILVGRPRVMSSWRAILGSNNPRIVASGAQAMVVGDAAYVVCFEGASGEPPILVATNIFARENGRWRIIHHQAGQLARTPDTTSGPSN